MGGPRVATRSAGCGLPVRVFGVERVGGDGCVGDGKDVQGVGIDDGVLEEREVSAPRCQKRVRSMTKRPI